MCIIITDIMVFFNVTLRRHLPNIGIRNPFGPSKTLWVVLVASCWSMCHCSHFLESSDKDLVFLTLAKRVCRTCWFVHCFFVDHTLGKRVWRRRKTARVGLQEVVVAAGPGRKEMPHLPCKQRGKGWQGMIHWFFGLPSRQAAQPRAWSLGPVPSKKLKKSWRWRTLVKRVPLKRSLPPRPPSPPRRRSLVKRVPPTTLNRPMPPQAPPQPKRRALVKRVPPTTLNRPQPPQPTPQPRRRSLVKRVLATAALVKRRWGPAKRLLTRVPFQKWTMALLLQVQVQAAPQQTLRPKKQQKLWQILGKRSNSPKALIKGQCRQSSSQNGDKKDTKFGGRSQLPLVKRNRTRLLSLVKREKMSLLEESSLLSLVKRGRSQDMLWQWTGTIPCTSRTMFHKRIWTAYGSSMMKAMNYMWCPFVATREAWKWRGRLGVWASLLSLSTSPRTRLGGMAKGSGYRTIISGSFLMTAQRWFMTAFGDAFGCTRFLTTSTEALRMLLLTSSGGIPWSEGSAIPCEKGLIFSHTNPLDKREVEVFVNLSLVKRYFFLSRHQPPW